MSKRTKEQNRRYARAAYNARIARGQCGAGCGVVLPQGHPWRLCDACRSKQRERYQPRGSHRRPKVFLTAAERIAIYQRYENGTETTRQLAAALGKSIQSVRALVYKVRASLGGVEPRPLGPRLGPRSVKPQTAYARCKCGLLLPCWNCVTAVEAATRRRDAA